MAQRYRCRVWSKFNIQTYLSEQAKGCANFAASWFFSDSADKLDRTYLLQNPHGKRHHHLGEVHFRTPTPFSCFLPEDTAFDVLTPCIAIERISLHPSVQNTGFLNMLAEQLELQGIRMLVLQQVFNSSFAYRLFQKSLEANSNILLLSDSSTINFDICISPGPTFGWKLGRKES